MAQYRLNAYDADVFIPEFKGLMEYGDQMGTDLRYSPECLNVETPGGVLQPAVPILGCVISNSSSVEPDVNNVLMHLINKVGILEPVNVLIGNGKKQLTSGEYNTLLFSSGNKLYSLNYVGDLDLIVKSNSSMMSEKNELTGTFHTNRWSWCTYEKTDTYDGDQITFNILLMSNPYDGLYYYWKQNLVKVTGAPAKFSYIARYADRIWGCSGDTLYYSKPYDPTDWDQNDDIPEDGGGIIREPTWDGDEIVGLFPFGDSLIAFSKLRAWRITGTDPSNFVIQEQFGNGCPYPDTVAVMNNRILMLGERSLLVYDGMTVQPFKEAELWETFREITYSKDIKPKAIRIGNKYILSMVNDTGRFALIGPVASQREYADFESRNSQTIVDSITLGYDKPYRMIVYDEMDDTVILRTAPRVASFCNGTRYAIINSWYRRGVPVPAFVQLNYICRIDFDGWDTYYEDIENPQNIWYGKTTGAPVWTTPWITLGRKDIRKGGFDLYFTPQLNERIMTEGRKQLWPRDQLDGNSPDYDIPSMIVGDWEYVSAELKFTISTEKKSKVKRYTVTAANSGKQKRLHFGGTGRQFRLTIEGPPGIPWRLVGGIHIIAETDPD